MSRGGPGVPRRKFRPKEPALPFEQSHQYRKYYPHKREANDRTVVMLQRAIDEQERRERAALASVTSLQIAILTASEALEPA